MHKPGPFKHTLNPPGHVGQATSDTDNPASNGSRENHTVPLAYPAYCSCECHNPSKNGPQKTKQYQDNYITSSGNNNNKEPRRFPPDLPIPTRPLPKETLQLNIINGNKTEPSGDAPAMPFQKSTPTSRKWSKEKMLYQEQFKRPNNELIFESLRNELSRLCEPDGKPKTILVKCMLSKEDCIQTECFSLPFRKIDNANKIKKKLSSCLRSQSFQESAKCSEQSSDTILPPSSLKVKRAFSFQSIQKSYSDGGKKKEGGHFQEAFWQEHHVVKKSGILNSLTPEEICLQESIYEVATSEKSYLERLNVVVNHFMKSAELTSTISSQDQKSLFSSICKMREISQRFLNSMVQEMGYHLICNVLCDVVYHYAIGPLNAYVDYIRNMPCQKHTLNNLRKENPRFVEILNKLQEDSCCNRLPLDSFLSLPFQRISHLKVLMETILKRTAQSQSNVQLIAKAALTKISEVLEKCNREVGKVNQIKELVDVVNKIEFECKSCPLVSPSRWLIRIGEMTLLARNESIFGQKKNCPVHLILFNDLLLLASKKGSDKYVVHDHVHRSLIEVTEGAEVEDDLEGYDVSRVFQLAIVKKKGNSYQVLLQASSLEERNSWLMLLKSEEGVYEEWDCPQVQCIEVYNGQQLGELNLEPGDIVSVIQKKSDGLMEGRKLPGMERGWFPAKCVVEIINEHVQRRNLRQRHHVLQTAASIIKCHSISQERHTATCFNIH
ncbi:hypothetical protein HF521_000744 [Silurus meridionalis]|uniref:Uncharacterized protein n=2 Tax=Silurus meridionalis TaxID=175797 RepID=A0A8T0BZ00_SILME|nr:hypothetical protein HF521_000744 [Silurus meridionalis]